MKKEEWHNIYKQTLIDNANITEEFAEECLQAGMENHDYNDDPETSAMTELSYWDE